MSKDIIEGGDAFNNRRALGTASFVPQEDLDRNGYEYGDFWLGRTLNGAPFGWREDMNLLTCAGSRSGKGVGVVVPNLLDFPGSAVVIDPKGELADLTADYRRRVLGHRVIVLDPAGVATNIPDDLRGTYNPLDALDIDDPFVATAAQTIATGIVAPRPDAKEPIWDDTAIDFIQAVLLYMLVHYEPQDRHLVKFVETMFLGDVGLYDAYVAGMREDDPDFRAPRGRSFDMLLDEMVATENFPLNIRASAEKLDQMGEKFKGDVLGTARTHLDFLKSPELWSALMPASDPARTFKLSDLRNQDQPLTVYLCLPIDMIPKQGRWLRLVITQVIQYIERTQAKFNKDRDLPILMLIDEFFQLGPMPTIVNTLTYAPGSGLRMWLIVQDLVQLKTNYPKSWETIVGACGIQQFFGVNDLTTAKYLSEMVGDSEVLVPSVAITDTESETEGTSQSATVGTSESSTFGTSESATVGRSSSDSTNSSVSRSYGTSESSSVGTNWGTSESQGTNWGQSHTGPQNNPTIPAGAPVNYSHGGNSGTQSSRGGNAGRSTSSSESVSYTSGRSHSDTRSESLTEGSSASETQGRSQSVTEGRSLSASRGRNYGLTYTPQVRRLMKPEELRKAFTKENLLQLVMIRDQDPMILFRTPFYADPDFQAQIEAYEAGMEMALLPAPDDMGVPLPDLIDTDEMERIAVAIEIETQETENDD